jgi:hypothetical protein
MVLVRLPFALLDMVPGAVEFYPGIALVPVAGLLLGPAGVICAAVGTLAGDALTGWWGPATGYRVLGSAAAAMTAAVLADGPADPTGPPRGPSAFLTAALPAVVAAAAWHGYGASSMRLYPFIYVAALTLANGLLFTVLLGLPLWGVLRSPRWGVAAALHAGPHDAPGRSPAWVRHALWSAPLGACLLALVLSGWRYQIWPTRVFRLGTQDGWWVRTTVAAGLLVHTAALLRAGLPFRRRTGRRQRPRRLQGVYVPPIMEG